MKFQDFTIKMDNSSSLNDVFLKSRETNNIEFLHPANIHPLKMLQPRQGIPPFIIDSFVECMEHHRLYLRLEKLCVTGFDKVRVKVTLINASKNDTKVVCFENKLYSGKQSNFIAPISHFASFETAIIKPQTETLNETAIIDLKKVMNLPQDSELILCFEVQDDKFQYKCKAMKYLNEFISQTKDNSVEVKFHNQGFDSFLRISRLPIYHLLNKEAPNFV